MGPTSWDIYLKINVILKLIWEFLVFGKRIESNFADITLETFNGKERKTK